MPDHAHLRLVSQTSRMCDECRLRARCLPRGLSAPMARAVTEVIRAHPPVARGAYLFRQGAPMTSYYFLRSGSAKSVVGDGDGRESVMSFLYPSDVIGAGSMDQTTYHDSVIALERSSFCEVRSDDLTRVMRDDPAAQRTFLAKVSNRIATERHARLRLGHVSADERVADFIIELSGRMAALERKPYELFLPMSRHDIASNLGLASETISRVLTRFANAGLITVRQKRLGILDPGRLSVIARGLEEV